MDYTVIDPKNTVIDAEARIGKNTIIEPFCVVGKNCRIGENCIIGSFSYLVSSPGGDFSEIRASRLTDSEVGCRTTVGPDAHLRQNSVVGDGCRVGNFVELKNSVLGDGSKASHLAYIGDAVVGKNCNVGCGAVFVNFDGVSKHRTVVGDNVFIGSNCNLIAPLTLADGTYVACSTTVTKDTMPDDFVIGRSDASVKHGRASRLVAELKEQKTKIDK